MVALEGPTAALLLPKVPGTFTGDFQFPALRRCFYGALGRTRTCDLLMSWRCTREIAPVPPPPPNRKAPRAQSGVTLSASYGKPKARGSGLLHPGPFLPYVASVFLGTGYTGSPVNRGNQTSHRELLSFSLEKVTRSRRQ